MVRNCSAAYSTAFLSEISTQRGEWRRRRQVGDDDANDQSAVAAPDAIASLLRAIEPVAGALSLPSDPRPRVQERYEGRADSLPPGAAALPWHWSTELVRWPGIQPRHILWTGISHSKQCGRGANESADRRRQSRGGARQWSACRLPTLHDARERRPRHIDRVHEPTDRAATQWIASSLQTHQRSCLPPRIILLTNTHFLNIQL